MPSIEVFIKEFDIKKFEENKKVYNNISFLFSYPALSHREPSLWQKTFDSLGEGYLCHIGEKCFEETMYKEGELFSAYNLIHEYSLKDLKFSFKENAWIDIKDLLKELLKYSSSKQIYFTIDMQFGGKRKKLEHTTIEDLFLLHKKRRFRLNSFIPVVVPRKYQVIKRNKEIKGKK